VSKRYSTKRGKRPQRALFWCLVLQKTHHRGFSSYFSYSLGRGILRSSPRGVYLGGLRSSGVSGFRCHQPHAFLASLTASINDSTASNIDRANAATQHLNRKCPTTRIRPSLPTVPMCRRLLYVAPPSRREQPRPSF